MPEWETEEMWFGTCLQFLKLVSYSQTLHLYGFTISHEKTLALTLSPFLLFWEATIKLTSVTIICCSLLTPLRGEDCPLLEPSQGLECFCKAGIFCQKSKM